MSSTSFLLHLVGDVALLIWGMHMVHTGIERAYGAELRHFLGTGLKSRWRAFLAGLGVTAVLQSSTATGLMATSFLAGGLMELVPALAVILGANVGTTLIVQVLSFNVSEVAPVLLVGGIVAFKRAGKTRTRDLGRVAIGLGLVLFALHLMMVTVSQVGETTGVRELFHALTGAPLLNVLLGAILTWAAYSSVAVVLLVMSLASSEVITPVAALALVLGANLGSVIPQYLAAGANQAARRLAAGNLIVRGAGAIAFFPLLGPIAGAIGTFEAGSGRLAADFHTGFNVVLALLGIGLLGPLARLCRSLLPVHDTARDPSLPRYLRSDPPAQPALALADAAREVLRMVDIVEAMLDKCREALKTGDRRLVSELGRIDDTLDGLHGAIKLHLMEISRAELDPSDARRCEEILGFTVNLEHIGDIIDKNLRELAAKRIKNQLTFSPEGLGEMTSMMQRLLDQLQLAVTVFMTRDIGSARSLLAGKEQMRDLEQAATANHFQRLREGRPESIETSALHLDIIRDLKRIAAHIASVAYPVLDEGGELRPTRLRAATSAES
jgi:phosphate:Na+ symporter